MKSRCVRPTLFSVVVLILVGSVFYAQQLRCLVTPCQRIISVKGPDQFGEIMAGQEESTLNSSRHGVFSTGLPTRPKYTVKGTVPDVIKETQELAKTATGVKHYETFAEALKDRADVNNVVILLSVDAGYIDMALNILESSLLKLGLNNFLFVCSDEQAVQLLNAANVSCFLRKVTFGKDASNYGSRAFVQKTHIKTHIILEALELHYTVFILDVDIMLFKNPMPYFDCKSCDIQIQIDGKEGNTGFYLVRPTKPGIEMHMKALELAKKSTSTTNQMALDRTMEKMIRENKINARYLDVNMFPHGEQYFEKGRRAFAGDNPCEDCIMVHNNWLVSGAAKIYRFKEHLMWVVDRDHYYSSPYNKYLIYDNPLYIKDEKSTIEAEKKALRSALAIGLVLNRIVILPSFHCYSCKYKVCQNVAKRCPLMTHVRLKTFDGAFSGLYREHVFLKHHKVPQSVKDSTSDLILIDSDFLKSRKNDGSLSDVKLTFTPKNLVAGATSDELIEWFEPMENVKVLRFHSMYNAFSQDDKDFERKLTEGIKKADYRQY